MGTHLFDRWRNVVYFEEHFIPKHPAYAWDGSMKGRDLNPGVFAYLMILKFRDGTTDTKYGDITIVR